MLESSFPKQDKFSGRHTFKYLQSVCVKGILLLNFIFKVYVHWSVPDL